MRALIAACLSLALIKTASAACWQELATYKDAGTGAELAFIPRGEAEVDTTLARFTITFPENNVVLDGVVMDAGDPFPRPLGIIMHNCPTGDATGDEIAACTVWQGIIYGLDGVGNANYLAPSGEGNEAAKALLFHDLRAAVRLSSAWGDGKLSQEPGDQFTQSVCLE
jgi:hypothetical protein